MSITPNRLLAIAALVLAILSVLSLGTGLPLLAIAVILLALAVLL